MQDPDNRDELKNRSLWDEFKSKKVSDVGVFQVNENDFFLVKWFKLAVNYTIFGFVMFMTFIIVLISFIAF